MPIIQLSFPNPLNTSVQVGDNAYFSNPTPISTAGNPLGGQWTSTTTPHMTNDIDGVVDLGEIVAVIPWDGTNSFIQCDMDQVLFNKYFSSIIAGGCVTGPQAGCGGKTPVIDFPAIPISADTSMNIGSGTSVPHKNALWWFFDNPTVRFSDVMFHGKIHAPSNCNWGGWCDTPSLSDFLCRVPTGIKSINGLDDHDGSAGTINWWVGFKNAKITITDPAGGYSQDTLLDPTANEMLDYLMSINPTAYSYGMNALQVMEAGGVNANGTRYLNYIEGDELWYKGQSVVNSQICTTGSYIMFSKDNKANMSSILGYYASVELRNSSQIKSELFNVGADFFESSK